MTTTTTTRPAKTERNDAASIRYPLTLVRDVATKTLEIDAMGNGFDVSRDESGDITHAIAVDYCSACHVSDTGDGKGEWYTDDGRTLCARCDAEENR